MVVWWAIFADLGITNEHSKRYIRYIRIYKTSRMSVSKTLRLEISINYSIFLPCLLYIPLKKETISLGKNPLKGLLNLDHYTRTIKLHKDLELPLVKDIVKHKKHKIQTYANIYPVYTTCRQMHFNNIWPWLLASPSHQHSWYWLRKICRSLCFMRKDYNFLCHVCV